MTDFFGGDSHNRFDESKFNGTTDETEEGICDDLPQLNGQMTPLVAGSTSDNVREFPAECEQGPDGNVPASRIINADIGSRTCEKFSAGPALRPSDLQWDLPDIDVPLIMIAAAAVFLLFVFPHRNSLSVS